MYNGEKRAMSTHTIETPAMTTRMDTAMAELLKPRRSQANSAKHTNGIIKSLLT